MGGFLEVHNVRSHCYFPKEAKTGIVWNKECKERKHWVEKEADKDNGRWGNGKRNGRWEDGNCLRGHKNKQRYKKVNWKSKMFKGYLSSQHLKGFWIN